MLINMMGFNVAWFGLIYLGNSFVPVALLMLLAHFKWLSKSKNEITLVLVVSLIGISVDSLFQLTNVFIFPNNHHIPVWLVFIWLGFATTISHSLSFLAAYKPLQILLGFVMAPLSYRTGEMLGAVEFGQSYLSTHFILGTTWALLLLLFFSLKARFNQKELNHA